MTLHASEKAWDLLHEVRLRGVVASSASVAENELLQAEWIVLRGANVVLTPAGREAHAAWARLAVGSPEEELARQTYDRFLVYNTELLEVCTAWQLRPDGGLNDHSDRAYDFSVIERLDRLHERVAPLIDRLGERVRRFDGYTGRLAAALDRVADDRQWFASPRCDSYHTVWMQLHEDLLGAVGASREDEPEPR